MPRSAAHIRREFIDFFVRKHGHAFVPSSPVVPHNDPTLLFTNAGMNQFKPIFLGQESRGESRDYRRAANSQKCIRAGGKHNDLEDVGKDSYHHTFFEMLGNWSFGDYFKAEAIAWAWELLTEVWDIEPGRLHATYFQGDPAENLQPDHEARDLWLKYLPPQRVHPGSKKDNFWEMGETGPCGPCSEIHFDATPDRSGGGLVNAGDPRVIEIWNLVFIQFNRAAGGGLVPLPARHVDTGMGFERVTRVLQGKDSNYDTDVFTPIFRAIREKTGARDYTGKLDDHVDTAYRVIADHIRCLTMAITDGAVPSNEGRGYVLRRILRRAVRHAHQTLGVKGPVLCELVPSVVESLGEAFPELKKSPRRIADVVREEEESFLKTLDRGLELFQSASARTLHTQISAADAFKLHDTYGFPIDLTRVMAEERGMTVDIEGYEKLMEEARERSRAGGEAESPGASLAMPPDAIARLKHMGVKPTADLDKYHGRTILAEVKAVWNGDNFDQVILPGHTVAVILDRTNHYAEQGGQVGDTGSLQLADGDARFDIHDTQTSGGYIVHIGQLAGGRLTVGSRVEVAVHSDHREPVRANHTGTHLLNLALRQVLGDGVEQKGSLVAPDRLRFDFSHGSAMTASEIEEVEQLVNASIARVLAVHAQDVPLARATSINGVRAVFGERYPDPVRVVSIGVPIPDLLARPEDTRWRAFSIEFCGGTHLADSSEAKHFVITHESALAAGVRRVIALTGAAAQAATLAGAELEARTGRAQRLRGDELINEVTELGRQIDELTLSAVARHRILAQLEPLRESVRALRKQAAGAMRDRVVERARQLADVASGDLIVDVLFDADKDSLLSAMDAIRAKRPDAAAMLFTPDFDESKVSIVAAVPKPMIARGLKAGEWVKQAATICGGSGGGRPDMAQAGGKDPRKIDEAIATARDFARRVLN
jgi:alanyl-tRNA synthetase